MWLQTRLLRELGSLAFELAGFHARIPAQSCAMHASVQPLAGKPIDGDTGHARSRSVGGSRHEDLAHRWQGHRGFKGAYEEYQTTTA
jgi:hypothetical protein